MRSKTRRISAIILAKFNYGCLCGEDQTVLLPWQRSRSSQYQWISKLFELETSGCCHGDFEILIGVNNT